MVKEDSLLTQLLEKKEKAMLEEILPELNAIRTLLGKEPITVNTGNVISAVTPIKTVKQKETTQVALFKVEDIHNAVSVPPKDDNISWSSYVISVLNEIGGVGKTNDVILPIIKSNQGLIDEKTIKSAVRHHLSKAYNEGVIGANKTISKKDGYTYTIKK